MFSYKRFFLSSIVLFSGLVASNSFAAVPAGTIIGNAATATYYDENNNQYTTTSNIVQTVVQAVCGVDIYPDTTVTKEGVPGQIVYLPFQIKNTGNAKNTYSLSLQNGNFTKDIYLDENQNGIVDPGEQIVTSLTLGMDEVASVIVTVQIPANAAADTVESFTLQAYTDNDCSDEAQGEVKVLTDAVFLFNKSVDKSVASPEDYVTYNISFKNTGTKEALAKDGFNVDIDNDGTVNNSVEGILIKDQIPENTTYVLGSASGTPTSNPNGFVVYSADGVNWFKDENKVNGTITYVGFFMPDQNPEDDTTDPVILPDQQGSFTFKVKIEKPYKGDGTVDNKAYIEYKTFAGIEKEEETNQTVTTIPVADQVDISLGGENNPEEDSGNNWEDDNTKYNIPAGSWVSFIHTAKNNGNVEDVINLTLDEANTNLPANAIVEFWNSDMTAKLIDTDADGNVDLGALDKGESRNFVVKVFIPADTPAKEKDGTVDYYITIEGISKNNPEEKDKTRSNIDGIIPASVDIGKWNTVGDDVNDPSDNDTDGTGDSDDILPQDNNQVLKVIIDQEKCSKTVLNTVNPGETAVYPIEILNRGGFADSFALEVENKVGNIKFLIDENCDGLLDKEVTNTPLIGGTVLSQDASSGDTEIFVEDVSALVPGDIIYVGDERNEISAVDIENKKITLKVALSKDHQKGTFISEAVFLVMEVQLSETQQPGEYNLIIKATSKNSNASDSMDAYLKVNSINNVVLSPNGSDQLPPGGTTTYQHTIINKGNAPVDVKVKVPTNTKLTYIILDKDKNPQGTEFSLPNPLNPNDTYTVYIKAIAPSDIQPGTVETIEVKVVDQDNDAVVYDTAQDTTTVIEGFMQLTKSVDKTEVKPGETVTYTIKYKNIGDRKALNVVITDNIPNYTQYMSNSMCLDSNCDGTCDQSITDASGDDIGEYDTDNNLVRFRVGTGADATKGGTVEPGEEGCVIFKVKIQE